jgi:phage terminase small subunit
MALNEKQEKFCQNYILHRNATEAAKAAGYSPESAKNQGYRLLQNSEIRVRGAKPEKDSMVSVETIEEEIVEYMKIIGEQKVQKLFDQAFNIRQKNIEYDTKEDDEDDD